MRKAIRVKIQLFSDFLQYLPPNTGLTGWEVSIEEKKTIDDLLNQIMIPTDLPMVITVNDANKTSEYPLQDTDIVKIFSIAMGG